MFTNDGKSVYFTRNNLKGKKYEKSSDGTIKLKIYKADLDKNGKSYKNVVELPFNNKEYNTAHPAISADGKRLYFSSDRPGGYGGMDLYVSEFDGANWSEPKNLGDKINTPGNEVFPFVTEDEVLYFSSNGLEGLGGLDIYEVKMKDGKPGKLYNMGAPINGENDDFGIWFEKDKKSGYFSSNRKNKDLDDDVYSFEVLRNESRGPVVKVITKSKDNGSILPSVKVEDGKGGFTSNEKGEITFYPEEPSTWNYVARKDSFFDGKESLTLTQGDFEEGKEIVKEIYLEKDPGIALRGTVTDSKSGAPLEGVKVKITDTKTGKFVIDELTGNEGKVFKALSENKVNDELVYKIELRKDGYFPKDVDFKKVIDKPGIIDIQEALKMDKEVKDLRELVEINDIRFDLNKYNIRPDAAAELDKIVEIMNKYPGMVVELGSHTDCRASKAYNMQLSDKRAKASAEYIRKRITNPQRIYGKGYRESRLLNDCACEGPVKSYVFGRGASEEPPYGV